MTPAEKEKVDKMKADHKAAIDKLKEDNKAAIEKLKSDHKEATEKINSDHKEALAKASDDWKKKFEEAEEAANKKLSEATKGLDEYKKHLAEEEAKAEKIQKDNLKSFIFDKDRYKFNKEIDVKKFKHTNDSFVGIYLHTVLHDDLLMHCFINHETMENNYIASDPQIDAAIVGNSQTNNRLRIIYTEDDKTDNERFTVFQLK